MQRYSLGVRVDDLFAAVIEGVSKSQFSKLEKRGETISEAITKNDTLKFMLFALLELKGISDKDFADLSLPLEEVGKMLYGWKNRSDSQKSERKP